MTTPMSNTSVVVSTKLPPAQSAGANKAAQRGAPPRAFDSLLVLSCRAVERLGQGSAAETALGGRERWADVRVQALGPLIRAWPRLGQAVLWDARWYREPDFMGLLLDRLWAIDRTDARLFPARNCGTMRDWAYAHGDGRAAPRLRDTHADTEARLRHEACDGSPAALGWKLPHACSLSLPARLILPNDVAHLVGRQGGPRQRIHSSVANVRFVKRPYPVMALPQSILSDALSQPFVSGAPVAPAYPFDHVVVAEWRRDAMQGVLTVNANPDAAQHGSVCVFYLGAETIFVPQDAPLGDLMHAFEIARQKQTRSAPGGNGDGDDNDIGEEDCDMGAYARDKIPESETSLDADQSVCEAAPLWRVDHRDDEHDFFLWLMRRPLDRRHAS